MLLIVCLGDSKCRQIHLTFLKHALMQCFMHFFCLFVGFLLLFFEVFCFLRTMVTSYPLSVAFGSQLSIILICICFSLFCYCFMKMSIKRQSKHLPHILNSESWKNVCLFCVGKIKHAMVWLENWYRSWQQVLSSPNIVKTSNERENMFSNKIGR